MKNDKKDNKISKKKTATGTSLVAIMPLRYLLAFQIKPKTRSCCKKSQQMKMKVESANEDIVIFMFSLHLLTRELHSACKQGEGVKE